MQEELCPQQALKVVVTRRAALPGHLSARQKTSFFNSKHCSKQSAPQTWRTGQSCAWAFPHAWATQELQVWRQQQGSALVGCPLSAFPTPCSAGALSCLPDAIEPCTQHELQTSLSLPTNLFQFIKLTNGG